MEEAYARLYVVELSGGGTQVFLAFSGESFEEAWKRTSLFDLSPLPTPLQKLPLTHLLTSEAAAFFATIAGSPSIGGVAFRAALSRLLTAAYTMPQIPVRNGG